MEKIEDIQDIQLYDIFFKAWLIDRDLPKAFALARFLKNPTSMEAFNAAMQYAVKETEASIPAVHPVPAFLVERLEEIEATYGRDE